MKPKILLPGLLALLMALGTLTFTSGLTFAQGPVGSGSGSSGYGSGPYDYGPGGSGMYPGMGWPENVNLPPALSFLQGESPQQIYQQMRGMQMTFAKPDGTTVTVTFTPGTVTAISQNSLTITPNGSSTPQQYTLDNNMIFQGRPTAVGSNQAISQGNQAISQGNQVIVASVQSSNNAIAVLQVEVPQSTHSSTGSSGASGTSGTSGLSGTATPTTPGMMPVGTPTPSLTQ